MEVNSSFSRFQGAAIILLLTIAITYPVEVLGQSQIWSQNYGGRYNESGASITHAGREGFASLGSTYSYGNGDHDFYLVCLDSLGDSLWTRTYGGANADYGYDLQRVSDGGFILVGTTYSFGAGNGDVYLIRVNEMGLELWSKTYGGTGLDEGQSVREATDGGFIIGASTDSYGAGAEDLYLLKVDSTGTLEWSRTYGGAKSEWIGAVRVTPDGGYVVVGSTTSDAFGYSDVYLIKTDSAGDSVWAKKYGGSKADLGSTIELTSDGGFILAGHTASWSLDFGNMYVLKVDSNGFLEWENNYGGAYDERANAVIQTADGGYFVSGTTRTFGAGKTDMYVLRLDNVGWQIWSSAYGGVESESGRGMLMSANGDIAVVGVSYSFTSGGSDLYIIKAQGDLSTDVRLDELSALPTEFALKQNYPNPFNPETTIPFTVSMSGRVRLTVYNILGQEVATLIDQSLSRGEYELQWDGRRDGGESLATGVYFYRLEAAGNTYTKKMTYLK